MLSPFIYFQKTIQLILFFIMKKTQFSSIILMVVIAFVAACCTPKEQEPVLPFPEPEEGDTLTVAQAIEYVKFLGTDVLSKPLFVKGVIASIDQERDLLGRAIFDIKDADADNRFTCFQVHYLQDKIFTDEDKLTIGDEIIVSGRILYFKGKEPQTQDAGRAYVYSHNGLTEVPKVISEDKLEKITINQAIDIIDTLTNLYSQQIYQIECTVQRITLTEEMLLKTGAANMLIKDSTGSMTAYQVKNVGNVLFESYSEIPPEGSSIIVVGKLTKYNTTYEIANGYIKEVIAAPSDNAD